ncbi:hypothetical protein WDW89_05410 [Deltaproteobacteria bacterium TL4]
MAQRELIVDSDEDVILKEIKLESEYCRFLYESGSDDPDDSEREKRRTKREELRDRHDAVAELLRSSLKAFKDPKCGISVSNRKHRTVWNYKGYKNFVTFKDLLEKYRDSLVNFNEFIDQSDQSDQPQSTIVDEIKRLVADMKRTWMDMFNFARSQREFLNVIPRFGVLCACKASYEGERINCKYPCHILTRYL